VRKECVILACSPRHYLKSFGDSCVFTQELTHTHSNKFSHALEKEFVQFLRVSIYVCTQMCMCMGIYV